ncbi:MAG: maleylpyruvate isomerase N-terminal domain-containing protein [Vicinamibacterales bacterium]
MTPILTAHLLPTIEARLIELLRSLRADEWEAQTVVPAWKVRVVAAHLLDTQLRKLSRVRDRYASGPPPSFKSKEEFVAFIGRLNREGVEMYPRLSPAVLIAMMEIASRESAEFHQSLDPMAEAAFSVSWVGE